MPLMAPYPSILQVVAREMQAIANQLDVFANAWKRRPAPGVARAHPELRQVARRFQRINQTLAQAKKAGAISAVQQRSIARDFAGIAQALKKGAGTRR